MIRINLLKNTGGTSNLQTDMNAMTGITIMGAGGDSVSSDVDSGEMIKKIVVLLLFPILLIGYEIYFVGSKKMQLASLKTTQAELQQKLDAFGPRVDAVNKFKQEKENLQKRLDVIKALSQDRMKTVKALDALHTIVPAQAWLTNFSIKGVDVKVSGYASDDIAVSNLIQSMSESIYFGAVRLVSSEEEKTSEGIFRKFNINATLGKF